ncbi:MAG: hypothetical protein IKU33_00445, partial [Bacteroidales bacterium]|nr:hypothetical protein [Bacteroidales bacterium]
MRKNNMCLTAALAAVFAFFPVSCSKGENVETVVEEIEVEDTLDNSLGFCPDSLRMVEGKVKSGQFFSNLLGGLGMSQQEAYNLTVACDSVFDVKTLRVGNAYRAYYDDADTLSDGGRLR